MLKPNDEYWSVSFERAVTMLGGNHKKRLRIYRKEGLKLRRRSGRKQALGPERR